MYPANPNLDIQARSESFDQRNLKYSVNVIDTYTTKQAKRHLQSSSKIPLSNFITTFLKFD
jgi:hypothetical protein